MTGFVRLLSEQFPLLAFVVGLAMLSVGLWQLWPPAMFVVLGLVVCALAVGVEVASSQRRRTGA